LESGEYVPMMICNDGAVKTIMVKDWSYTPEEEEGEGEGEGG
jgi:hypothetical protein